LVNCREDGKAQPEFFHWRVERSSLMKRCMISGMILASVFLLMGIAVFGYLKNG
jgi:hypothetical protein